MTASATIQWLSKGQFVAIDSSKHSVVLSTQDAENGTGMKPSEMLLVAVGGCSSVDVVNILQKKRQHLSGLEVQVTAEQDPDPPWTFRKIRVTYYNGPQKLDTQMGENKIQQYET